MTKSKRIKVITIIISFVLLGTYIFWVSYLNATKGPINICSVSLGESIHENAYKYTATDINIYTEDEFSVYFQESVPKNREGLLQKIIVVDLDIEKIICDEQAIYKFDLANILLESTTFSQGVNFNAFSLINSDSMSLREVGDKIHIKLPYIITEGYIRTEKWNNLKNLPLSISLNNAESTKKVIVLSV